jgi:hypothetical protein
MFGSDNVGVAQAATGEFLQSTPKILESCFAQGILAAIHFIPGMK